MNATEIVIGEVQRDSRFEMFQLREKPFVRRVSLRSKHCIARIAASSFESIMLRVSFA